MSEVESGDKGGVRAGARPRQGRGFGHGHGHGHGMGRMAPGDKPRDFKGSLRRLTKLAGAFKIPLAIALVFALGSTIFSIVGPKVLSEATTALFDGAMAKVVGAGGIDFSFIAGVLGATLALYVVSAACSTVQGWIMSSVSQKMCYRLRRDIAVKIDRVPFGYFDENSTGDTLSRITNDVDLLGQTVNQGITQLITSVTTVIGVLAMMLWISVPMTIIALLIVPVTLALVFFVVKRSQKHFFAQQAALGSINACVEETFSGHEVVKAFRREDAVIERYLEINERLYETGWKSQFLSGLMQPAMGFVGNLGYVAVAVAGALLASAGAITVGDIQAFIQYMKNFTGPITQLAQVSNVLQQMVAAAERIFEFLDQEEELETAKRPLGTEDAASERAQGDAADASAASGGVVFDHVRFGYCDDKIVIRDFSARIGEGQTVAIVGPTGAGKTTLVKLLMRFYDVDGGSISIDGVDVRDLSRQEVRSRFAMVLQDTWLFSGTIRENIRYGDVSATDEDVEAAARGACAHRFIMTLPGGYDFHINEDAANISSGQRQLITIARALLSNRRMLILDEATSSVDTRTEERVQRAMDNLMRGRTSFVIAHRLSTIRNADLILVMDRGDIVEQGTHDELLARDGFYADLYRSQFERAN